MIHKVIPYRYSLSAFAAIFISLALISFSAAAPPDGIPPNERRASMPLSFRVCLTDALETAEISVAGPCALSVAREGGSGTFEVSCKKLSLSVKGVEKKTPAGIAHYAVLVTMPYSHAFRPDKAEIVKTRIAEAEKASQKTVFLTYGCLVSTGGSAPIDTRTLFIAEGPLADEETARKRCNELRERHKISAFVHPVKLAGPSCTFKLAISYDDDLGKRRAEEISGATGLSVSTESEFVIASVEFGRGEHWNNRRDSRYRGDFELAPDNSGRLMVINRIGLEELLEVVVPSEIESNAPYQAVCAQAIAARSEVLFKYGTRHTESGFDFCAGTHCQAYGGLSNRRDPASKAVRETAGTIATYDGRVIDTVYHANCGGATEDSNRIWSAPYDPALVGIADISGAATYDHSTDEAALARFIDSPPVSYCGMPGACDKPEKHRWKKVLTQAEIDALVAKQFPALGRVMAVKVIERARSGRITGIEVFGAKGSERVYKELPVRKLFGMLRSALFIVTREESSGAASFVFRGAGWGHGVGLCQDGAKGMALSGASCEEILRHYYSGIRIQKLK